jgi:hypothetical protein
VWSPPRGLTTNLAEKLTLNLVLKVNFAGSMAQTFTTGGNAMLRWIIGSGIRRFFPSYWRRASCRRDCACPEPTLSDCSHQHLLVHWVNHCGLDHTRCSQHRVILVVATLLFDSGPSLLCTAGLAFGSGEESLDGSSAKIKIRRLCAS